MPRGDIPPVPVGGKPGMYRDVARARLLAIEAQRRADQADTVARVARRQASQARLRYDNLLAEYEGQEVLDFDG